MFTDKGLEFLASAVGKPVRLHPKTEACSSFDEAQILVEADLTKDLPTEYVFNGEEEGELDVVIKYSYPWLPPRCSCCKKWGHFQNTCLAVTSSSSQQRIEDGEGIVAEQATELLPSMGDAGKVSTIEVGESIAVNDVANSEKVFQVEGLDQVEATGNEWLTPSKSIRSPGKMLEGLQYGEVSILTNPYSALSELEEVGEEKKDTKNTSLSQEVGEKVGTEEQSDIIGKNAEHLVDSTVVAGTDIDSSFQQSKPKSELPSRQNPPRESKTAHKIVSVASTQVRGPPQKKKHNPRHN